jgi:hypothetical protein
MQMAFVLSLLSNRTGRGHLLPEENISLEEH